MKLIVGLGNPTRRYADTRHNAGFMAVDRLAERHGLRGERSKFHAAVLDGQVDGQRAMLMKPQTYMNRSGTAVGEAARFFKLEPADVLIAVDDTALPVGTTRLRPSGGAGGHNGLADVQRALGTERYPRLRIGIGEPVDHGRRIPATDYVLAPFTEEQRPALNRGLDRAAEAIECWLEEGIEAAMNRFNRKDDQPEPFSAERDGDADAPGREREI
jgi:PTH1 family peptidyl-tRNA hydrolase